MASFLLMPKGGSRPWEPEGPGNARGWSSCHGVSRDKGTKPTSSNPTRSTEPTWPTHSQSLPSSPGYSTWFSSLGRFCSELPVSSFLLDHPQRRPGSLLSAPSFIQTQRRQRGENRGSGITHSHRTHSGYAGHSVTRGRKGLENHYMATKPTNFLFLHTALGSRVVCGDTDGHRPTGEWKIPTQRALGTENFCLLTQPSYGLEGP